MPACGGPGAVMPVCGGPGMTGAVMPACAGIVGPPVCGGGGIIGIGGPFDPPFPCSC